MPLACWPTSTDATRVNRWRSYTSTFPGAAPTPSQLTKAYRESDETAIPCVRVVELLACISSAPVERSKTWMPCPCLSEAINRLPSGVTARLYGPRPVGNRRVMAHCSRSISAIRSALLQATYTRLPSADGWAQVGEQLAGAMVGAPAPCAACACSDDASGRGPSFPLARPNRRLTSKVRVSISTSWSSIMQVEY